MNIYLALILVVGGRLCFWGEWYLRKKIYPSSAKKWLEKELQTIPQG